MRAPDPPNRKHRYPAEFERWWATYPEKVGKGAALRAWRRSVQRPPTDELIDAVRAHAKTDRWQRGIIPNPATWLNDRRWEDGPAQPIATRATCLVCSSPTDETGQCTRWKNHTPAYQAQGQQGTA